MSHNLVKLNTNAFDVNSNLTQSITSMEYAYVYPNFTGSNTYPRSVVSGQNFLWKNDNLYNGITGLTIVYNTTYTSHVETFRFTSDGTYKIFASASLTFASSNSGGQGYYLHDGTNVISNTSFREYNNLCYAPCTYMSGVIVRSGTDIDVTVKIDFASNVSTIEGSYPQSVFFVERLQ